MTQVLNDIASSQLDTIVLTDPVRIAAYKANVAKQMNDQSGGPKFVDLAERIQDIVIETAAQGASFLEVHLIDPAWWLLRSGFIQADTDGFLYPPIEINFPEKSDAIWRLCQCRPSKDLTQANVILTFEDEIASLLRDVDAKTGGVKQSVANETLGGFIKRLVDGAARATGRKMRLVELIAPSDPNYVAPSTGPKSSVAAVRTNPNKNPGGLTPSQQATVDAANVTIMQAVGNGANLALGELDGLFGLNAPSNAGHGLVP